ncbi:MAG: damage-inducible protein DinB, partial [Bacteroidetes bacterium]|nr:damage-inducible protein DinB [Bacteroidota bacterium]
GKELPRWVLIGKAFEHQTHTRGQTVAYLRLKGVKPPPEMLF